MNINTRFLSEVEDLGNKELFRAYHSDHVESRHICVDDRDLRERIKCVRVRVKNEPVLFSRFYGDLDEVLGLMQECILSATAKEIQNWDPSKEFLVLNMDCGFPIGCGLVKGADWRHPFEMNAIRVVLGESICRRLFSVVSAYPVPTNEQWPRIEQAMKTYAEYVKNRPVRKHYVRTDVIRYGAE